MTESNMRPVRTIGISSRAITGVTPEGWQFESSLERDLMELVRFDVNVKHYTPQPLTIKYKDASGASRRYTPDGFIQYRRDILPAKEMKHILCEVKYRADFRSAWRELLPKFRAAKQYCQENDWEFRVFTEREIRTPYLANVRFLLPYKERIDDAGLALTLLEKIDDLRETDAEALLVGMFRDKWNRANALSILWYLVATQQVGCELSEPLTMKSRLWTIRG